jgi:ketohexokinase
MKGRIPDVTIVCIRYLRKHFPDVKISIEVEKPQREGLEALANAADVIFYSKTWAKV